MTIDDMLAREAIRQTMVNYNLAGDRLRTDDFVAAFTEDGILESEGVPEADAFRYVGHAELRQWMDRWTRGGEIEKPRTTPASFIRHHLSTSQIELTGRDSARARVQRVSSSCSGSSASARSASSSARDGSLWSRWAWAWAAKRCARSHRA